MIHVGDQINADNANWSFSGDLTKHFDQHIEKSIPFYNASHELGVSISDFFLDDSSVCYDLGCSTGKLLTLLAQHHQAKRIQFIGIDVETEMVQYAQKSCQNFSNVEIREENLLEIELEKADLIFAYYTMQFIKPKHRQLLFNRIYQSLNWGGGFLLFEKVRSPDARFQDMMTTLYNDYKLNQGYSGDEIIAKSRSLKGVLEPFSTAGNLGLLERAGFVDITTIMKYICFQGFLAIK
ncbi:methyltransferase domain-containing protein [Euhalothece natronophila Z-M001]|uniref:Methyltransferase domain-containing protein n=1 Tax=Euhalothece natronophila Z-M001 TaxID=522448 RepID=A0A5B8NMC7_9CHRO|nr:methyltransferase domain-containing protein [Euhalothece natronophila]QDZ39701.1 methyltransferase domain-containing protein [Euhalothece natronophila Z-M001]